jgi:hypothetical protein
MSSRHVVHDRRTIAEIDRNLCRPRKTSCRSFATHGSPLMRAAPHGMMAEPERRRTRIHGMPSLSGGIAPWESRRCFPGCEIRCARRRRLTCTGEPSVTRPRTAPGTLPSKRPEDALPEAGRLRRAACTVDVGAGARTFIPYSLWRGTTWHNRQCTRRWEARSVGLRS